MFPYYYYVYISGLLTIMFASYHVLLYTVYNETIKCVKTIYDETVKCKLHFVCDKMMWLLLWHTVFYLICTNHVFITESCPVQIKIINIKSSFLVFPNFPGNFNGYSIRTNPDTTWPTWGRLYEINLWPSLSLFTLFLFLHCNT